MNVAVLISFLGLTGAPASLPPAATNAPAPAAAPEPAWSMADPVVVTAPSPRLWKLARGGSTVWVLGEIEPLPKGLSWNTAPLARIIQGADRVLLPPEGYGGVFEALRALARSRLPNGATLDATLPPALEARYRTVLARLGRNPNTPRRDKPAWAALFLELDFIRARGVDTAEPFRTIGRIARDKHVPVQRVASYKAAGVLDELVSLPEQESEAALAEAVAGVDFGLDHPGRRGPGLGARGPQNRARQHQPRGNAPYGLPPHAHRTPDRRPKRRRHHRRIAVGPGQTRNHGRGAAAHSPRADGRRAGPAPRRRGLDHRTSPLKAG